MWESFDAFLTEINETPVDQRQDVVDRLLQQRLEWPWVEDRLATFIWLGMGTERVALNLDTIEGDPPFASMENIEGTNLWYITREFASDDLLDYLLAVNDPMTPLATENDIMGRIARFWRVDPMNPTKMTTSQMNVSILRMQNARPFPDWSRMAQVPRGRVTQHLINSAQLRFTDRKLWVYKPPGYEESGLVYPLLVLQDGQWMNGPLQVPFIADTLIKHNRMEPIIIAMVQSGDQRDRIKTFVSNDKHYSFVLTELLPFLQTQYRIDSANLGIGGVSAGAIAAAHAALKNPAVFSHLAMISPPLGRGIAQDQLRAYAGRFQEARVLPQRIFQSVGRYETRSRFLLPARLLRSILNEREDVAYNYVEVGSGHGLVTFRSILPEALAWTFPGEAAVNGSA